MAALLPPDDFIYDLAKVLKLEPLPPLEILVSILFVPDNFCVGTVSGFESTV